METNPKSFPGDNCHSSSWPEEWHHFDQLLKAVLWDQLSFNRGELSDPTLQNFKYFILCFLCLAVHPKWSHMVPYMANIHQEQPFIRNMQVISSNRVHSTHSCEANKCRNFKPFFCLSDIRFLRGGVIIKQGLRRTWKLRQCTNWNVKSCQKLP